MSRPHRIILNETEVGNIRFAAINSPEPEYRLSWRLHNALGIPLFLNHAIPCPNYPDTQFIYYTAVDETMHTLLHLVRNKEGKHCWQASLSAFDYLLIGTDFHESHWNTLINHIQSVEGVLFCEDLTLRHPINKLNLLL
jgi:hypothetical protein